ncbi:MAG: thioredoxin family protein [Egibacteraceae bacterium]
MAIPSAMLPLGTSAPDFALRATDGSTVALADFVGTPALLMMFICNHCPYVKHVQDTLAELATEYEHRGVGVVGVCSNDAGAYPDDAPAELARQAERVGFTFPYLIDETQEVAKAYRAACTPDFFVFDADRKLAYRGQMDGSRPGNDQPVTGRDLRAALDAVLTGEPVPADQHPSLGCGIKWKPGNAPT